MVLTFYASCYLGMPVNIFVILELKNEIRGTDLLVKANRKENEGLRVDIHKLDKGLLKVEQEQLEAKDRLEVAESRGVMLDDRTDRTDDRLNMLRRKFDNE